MISAKKITHIKIVLKKHFLGLRRIEKSEAKIIVRTISFITVYTSCEYYVKFMKSTDNRIKSLGAPCWWSNRYFAEKIIGNFIEERKINYILDHDRLINSKASRHHCFHRKN